MEFEKEFEKVVEQCREWYPEFYGDDLDLLAYAESKILRLKKCVDLTPFENRKILFLSEIQYYLSF